MSERNKYRIIWGSAGKCGKGQPSKVLGGVRDRGQGKRATALCSDKEMCCRSREFASVKWD